MKRAAVTLFFFVLAGASCLDPLYEDGAPLTSGWVLCCQSGSVDTCFCDDASSCEQRFFPCAAGRCSASATCSTGAGGGAGGGSAAGGGTGTGGGGGFADAGSASDAGVFDAGVADAGPVADAGASNPEFQFCCVGSRVTTCACTSTACVPEPFTPCPGGSCRAGSTNEMCR